MMLKISESLKLNMSKHDNKSSKMEVSQKSEALNETASCPNSILPYTMNCPGSF